MRWPWSRDKEDLSEEINAAREEKFKAQNELAALESNTPYIRQLVEELEEMRRRNHFGQSIKLAYRGEPQ